MAEDALQTYQHYLDVMGDALIARDADRFLTRIFLPHVIETEDMTIRIDDIETARAHFDGFSRTLVSQGVDSYSRIARAAHFDGPDCLKGEHDTFITSHGKLVAPVFANEATLVRRGDLWGSVGTRHYARYVSWPDLLPRLDRP